MSLSGGQHRDFSSAVNALLNSLSSRTVFEADAFNTLLSGLTRYLQVTVPTLGRDEAVEVIDGAVLELMEMAAKGSVDRARDPAGLLIRITHRRAIDLTRLSRRKDVPLGERDEAAGPGADDLLSAIASKAEVQATMQRIKSAGRHELNTVLRAWLDLEDQFGSVSGRDVADRLGIDPSTVSRRLAEIRTFLDER